MNQWEIYILGTDEVVEIIENSYLEAITRSKVLSIETGKTHCVGLHGIGGR